MRWPSKLRASQLSGAMLWNLHSQVMQALAVSVEAPGARKDAGLLPALIRLAKMRWSEVAWLHRFKWAHGMRVRQRDDGA